MTATIVQIRLRLSNAYLARGQRACFSQQGALP